MEMTLRWYGPGYDSVSLEQIKQIPGVKGVVTTLMGKQAGEVWTEAEIAELKKNGGRRRSYHCRNRIC